MVEGEGKIQLQLSEIHLKKTKVETEKALALNQQPLTWERLKDAEKIAVAELVQREHSGWSLGDTFPCTERILANTGNTRCV